MAKAYQPFIIADQKTGLDTAKDPFLLPQDAWTELQDCYLYEGRIEKRQGQALLAGLDNRVWDVDSQQLVTSGGVAVVDPLVNTSLPIMGLFQYQNNLGGLQLIALTTQRLFSFIASLGAFIDMTGENLWSGTGANFFQGSAWLNMLFLANGKDQLAYYDGEHVWPVTIDPNQSGQNTVVGMTLVFPYYDRIVIFNTVETLITVTPGAIPGTTTSNGVTTVIQTVNGVTTTSVTQRIPQMARWSDIDNQESWSAQNYLRAPTSDEIIGACMIGQQLTVFFNNSVWAFAYTGNYVQPFEWLQIPGQGGAIAAGAVQPYQQTAMALGPERISATDGMGAWWADANIPQIMQGMNQTLLPLCDSEIHDQKSQVWFSFPSAAAATYPDSLLIYNYDTGAWSTGTFSQNCLGSWSQVLSGGSLIAGYPQMLAGTRNGQVLTLNTGGTDFGGAAITAVMMTGQINPFSKSNRRCWLGWVDLLVNTSLTGTITVSFYENGLLTPYLTLTGVPLVDSKAGTKSWVRLPVNVVADFHQIQITHATADQFVLHAMTIYAKPVGRENG